MLNGPRLPLPPPTPINPFAKPRPTRRVLGYFSLAGGLKALHTHSNSPEKNPLKQDEVLIRQSKAKKLAKSFCEATLEQRFGSDEKKVLNVLKTVQEEGIQPEFEIAAVNGARRHGKIYGSVDEIIEDELAGNVLEKAFKSAPRKEAEDYLKVGKNTYRGTGWDYRRYGMYRSLADFGAVCKAHPVMSAGISGTVAALGHFYPFLGAASGIAIMGWTTLFTAKNEIQAARGGKTMNAEKAEHYQASGENMAAFLLTASGYHGIKDGAILGRAAYSKAVQDAEGASKLTQGMKGLWKATSARHGSKQSEELLHWHATKSGHAKGTSQGTSKENPFIECGKRVLFVVGLFDNVLLPFNYVADKLSGKPSELE